MFLLHWRIGLNERLVDDWIDGQAFYRGQYVNEPIDNPEQRIRKTSRPHDELAEPGDRRDKLDGVRGLVFDHPLGTLGTADIIRVRNFQSDDLHHHVYVTIATVIAFKIGSSPGPVALPQRAVQRVLSIHFGPLHDNARTSPSTAATWSSGPR